MHVYIYTCIGQEPTGNRLRTTKVVCKYYAIPSSSAFFRRAESLEFRACFKLEFLLSMIPEPAHRLAGLAGGAGEEASLSTVCRPGGEPAVSGHKDYLFEWSTTSTARSERFSLSRPLFVGGSFGSALMWHEPASTTLP